MADAKELTIDPNAPVAGMDYHMHLNYYEVLCPVVREFADALMDKRIIGHKCPQCGLVYSPPKGYCPICVVPTDKSHEIELQQRGVVTNYTIVTPVQYHGQTETERFAKVSLQLDGGGTLSLQDLLETPVDDVRIGLRVEAIWAPDGERNVDEITNRSWGVGDAAIRGWRPTGEPDVPADQLADNVF